jgi:hypothetical protein
MDATKSAILVLARMDAILTSRFIADNPFMSVLKVVVRRAVTTLIIGV